jgi:hypothetical protein
MPGADSSRALLAPVDGRDIALGAELASVAAARPPVHLPATARQADCRLRDLTQALPRLWPARNAPLPGSGRSRQASGRRPSRRRETARTPRLDASPRSSRRNLSRSRSSCGRRAALSAMAAGETRARTRGWKKTSKPSSARSRSRVQRRPPPPRLASPWLRPRRGVGGRSRAPKGPGRLPAAARVRADASLRLPPFNQPVPARPASRARSPTSVRRGRRRARVAFRASPHEASPFRRRSKLPGTLWDPSLG